MNEEGLSLTATRGSSRPVLIPDVVYQVAQSLRPRDILSLMLTCSANYHVLRKLIYTRDVEIEAVAAAENRDLVSDILHNRYFVIAIRNRARGSFYNYLHNGAPMASFPYAAPCLRDSAEPALDWAISNGDARVARLAIEAGSVAALSTGVSRLRSLMPSSEDDFFESWCEQPTPPPLVLAAMANNLEIFKLIEPGVPKHEDPVTLAALDYSTSFDVMEAAVLAGAEDIVAYLLNGSHSEAFIQAWPEDSMVRYLKLAVESANLTVTGQFLDRFPDALISEGFHPVLKAIGTMYAGEEMIPLLDLLEERGLVLDALDSNNHTILHNMVRLKRTSTKVIVHLVQKGFDFWTPRGPHSQASAFDMVANDWFLSFSVQGLLSIPFIMAMIKHERHGSSIPPEPVTQLLQVYVCWCKMLILGTRPWPQRSDSWNWGFWSEGTDTDPTILNLDFIECLLGHEGVRPEAHMFDALRPSLTEPELLDKHYKSASSKEETARRILLRLDALSA